MAYNFPYLKDPSFLKEIDEKKLKEQYVKLVVLTFDEKPVQEIQGLITGGSLTLDGTSSMRRTGNLNMVANEQENSFANVKRLLGINKKIEVLVGFLNTTEKYKDYPILWFPQGVYVIVSPNISHSGEGVNISLTLHDKMALLNGECGGTLPASVTFHQVEDLDEEGNIQIKKPTIYQIIQEAVNHFGGEQLGKIIISDVDRRIKKVMRWTGSSPLYLYQEPTEDGTIYNSFSTNYNQLAAKQATGHGTIRMFSYGEDIGYILTDFVYPEELVGNAGDTVVSILDKIKETLGNYEYFYDIDGNFRFQEQKNYLNKSYSTILLDKMNASDYLVDYSGGKSVYSFDNSNIVQSFSNSPQYQQIKNDFVVWGKRTTIEGKDVPIRYHLAIDTKPEVGNTYSYFLFKDPDDGITKAKKPIVFESIEYFPPAGEVGQYYYSKEDSVIFKWNNEQNSFERTPYQIKTVTTSDFRTQLYMAGVASDPFGLESNYYYTELKNEWPKLYDIQKGAFFEGVLDSPSQIDFFLDFIDTPSAISEFSVQNIGRRTTTLVDDSINCIFEPDSPNIVIIEAGSSGADELQEECRLKRQEYAQVRPEVYSLLLEGGASKSAYEEIRKELYQYTNYNEQITLTVLPIYHLEPNTRITIRDNDSGIYGDYMIKNISLPLDTNGVMSISCVKALERI